jgi:predicted membrane channel-forming protein YqfA (hemolysin III family)
MMTIRSRRDNDDNILKQLQNRAVEETLNDLPYITEVFRNKKYNLNKTITNEIDFLLGAVFSQIIQTYSLFCTNRNIKPSMEQLEEFNVYLFSRAPEFKDVIIKLAGL